MCRTLQAQGYTVSYIIVDSSSQKNGVDLQTKFLSRDAATYYISGLPVLLQSQGFITNSIDSLQIDSANAWVQLFLGQRYKWSKINTKPTDQDILEAIRWNEKAFTNDPVSFANLQGWQEKALNYLEENGHPFAKISFDSIEVSGNEIKGLLTINRGPLYKIDSIRLYGDAKITIDFLQRYLELADGSVYNKKKLEGISKKIAQLSYVVEEKPSDLTLLGTGSVLNLYLKGKKNSQVNLLVGFLPNSDQSSAKKFQLTGEANILLRNALSIGETIGLNWQKLQPQSQRLNLLYEQPFIFKSPIGLGFNFNMFRKDSTFLNVDMKLAANYGIGSAQKASVFVQRRQSIVNGVNTTHVIFTKQLPQEGDVSSNNLGVSYEYNNTDNRLNPRKGAELFIITSAGNKKIKKNNQVLELKDPTNPSFKFESLYDTVKLKTYQLRLNAQAARYFSLGGLSVIKAGINVGIYQSGNIYRNELFQIGGYKLLRGFDEESQYVSQYAVGTLEYRFIINTNSNFFAFADGGWGRHLEKLTHTYIGTGLGISFETKAGIFNLVWALGKRDDVDFNLRQSKIHLGFVNYF